MRFGPDNGPHLFLAFVAFVVLVAIVAIVILAVLLVMRQRGHVFHAFSGASDRHGAYGDAMRILNERFARGEIDPEDYQTRRDLLRPPS